MIILNTCKCRKIFLNKCDCLNLFPTSLRSFYFIKVSNVKIKGIEYEKVNPDFIDNAIKEIYKKNLKTFF